MKKRSVLRKIVYICLVLIIVISVFFVVAVAYNNISFWRDKTFASRLDLALKNAEGWVETHKLEILEVKNAALLTMLRECNDLHPNSVFSNITTSFLNTSMTHYSKCMKREVDPNWPITESDLNLTIDNAALDYKWIYYAMAPDKTKFDAEKSGLFDGYRWNRRQLGHQLLALTMLRNRQGANQRLDRLLDILCERTKTDMTFCLPVVDIYIQRVAYVLRAGFPQKVRRRWVERIITEQQSDGGWNDRWFCFTTPRRQFIFNFNEMPSDQHATIQAVLALYLVKYRYPEHFGVK